MQNRSIQKAPSCRSRRMTKHMSVIHTADKGRPASMWLTITIPEDRP